MTSLRQAWRALVRRPVFTLAVVLTMTAGIGVTTASFSIVDRVLLRPLPFPERRPARQRVRGEPVASASASASSPRRDCADWNRLNRTFDAISGSYSESVTDTSNAEPERLEGRRVMPRFFDVLRWRRSSGGRSLHKRNGSAVRPWRSSASRSGRDASREIPRRSASASSSPVVATRSSASCRARSRAGWSGTALGTASSIDLWIPAQLAPRLLEIREARFLGGVGRMRPGVTTRAGARRSLRASSDSLVSSTRQPTRTGARCVMDLKETRVGDYRRALLLIFGAVGLLLLIAIANVAGLMLVQLRRRATELAIRSAIGASHRQVVMVIVREVAILAIAGAIAGALLALWLTAAIATGFTIPRISEVTVDRRALAFAAGHQRAGRRDLRPAARDPDHPARARAGALVRGTRRLRRTSSPSGIARCRADRAQRRPCWRGRIARAQLQRALASAHWLQHRQHDHLSRRRRMGRGSRQSRSAAGASGSRPAAVARREGRGLREFLSRDRRDASISGAACDGIAGPEADGQLTVGERTVTPGYLKALQVPLLAGEWCPEVRVWSIGAENRHGERALRRSCTRAVGI